ncbi:MAG: calcium/sodium antiporter [Alphaproteobacteria bacterium]|nr:calcium/sodium antiporter [Alphaproteobacteria bacterium]
MLYIYFIIGLVLLAFGGDTLVKGAVGVANKLKISPLVVGIVLVGFGTSTPELVASILSVFQKPPAPGIAVGNVIGSNIANVLLVLGAAALITPIKIDMKNFKRDSSFLVISSLALVVATFCGGLNFFGGIIFVAGLASYIYYCYHMESKNKKALKKMQKEIEETSPSKGSVLKDVVITFVGIGMTLIGAKLLVNSSITLARQWGISETIIGLTLVAVGTSLPELATSIVASVRKQNDVAFGNIVGSNIYNALFILGVVSLLTPINFPNDVWESLIIMCMVTLWLISLGIFHQISRKMGALFLIAYAGYVVCLM